MILRRCQFLKEVPDVSGAVNLRKLDISNCQNLIKVHDSMGLLDKLVSLIATACPNLRILPRSIKSASLESLDLSYCYSLQSFPQILGIFENLTDFNSEPKSERDVFSENLPFPVGHLSLLQHMGRFCLSCCPSMLPILENCKDVFQHSSDDNPERANPTAPVALHINGLTLEWQGYPQKIKKLDSKRENLVNRYFFCWRPYFHNFTTLKLPSCKLRNEFLYQLLAWFPYLNYLDVRDNNFTILPECISECLHLEILILDSCGDLREIKGIPPNIKCFWALDCMSLTSRSSSKLLSQAFHKDGGIFAAVPGYRIPKWFDYRCKGSSISFWCRNEFPRLAVCYIGNIRCISFRIFINGIPLQSKKNNCWCRYLDTPCMTLLNVREWGWEQGKIMLKENKWNHVLIAQDINDGTIIYEMGVHAYKETGTDDVQLIGPIDHNLDSITGFSLQKNFCPFLHMQVCDTKDSRKLARNDFYRFLNESSSTFYGEVSVRKAIRIMKAPTKVKLLVWRIFNRSLQTCLDLFIRELVNSPLCPICETKIETIDHVFLQCPWSRCLWFGSDLGSRFVITMPYILHFWFVQKEPQNIERDIGLMGHILWVIWKVRNDFILRNKPVDPYEALMTAKAMHMDYSSNPCSLQIERTRVGPSLEACTSTTHEDLQYNYRYFTSEYVEGVEVEYKARGKSKLMRNSNTEMEPICDKGTQVENRAKRKREEESKSNPEMELHNKVECSVVPLDHISRTVKESDVATKKVEELHKQQEEANQIFLDDETEKEAHLQKTKYDIKSQSTTASNQHSNLVPKKLQKKIVTTLQKSAQAISVNVTEQRTSSTNKNPFEWNPNSATSPKSQEISPWSISQLPDDFSRNEEPNIEQYEYTFNQENPDLPNLNIQLEVQNPDIQPQNIAPDPKQPFPTKTQSNSTQEKQSTGLNDDEEDNPFDVLESLVSSDESISTPTSHISEQEPRWNNERANQIKQAITILDNVLEQDFELLLSNQEHRENLESSLKILQSMTGEDALVTFGFKAFILQLRDQLPSMLENMSKSSTAEEAYQSLICHKQSLAEFHKSGGQQKRQLAEKRQACIQKVEANSNQISALRARILELQKELDQLEKTQPELEAVVKAVDIEEQNLIQRAKDAVKDFKSTTSKLSRMEAERKAMIEVKSKTLIQWQKFRLAFDSSFEKLIVD